MCFTEFNQGSLGGDPAVATLKVLMDQHNLNTTDFKNEIGGKSMVSQVLNGGKQLTPPIQRRKWPSPAFLLEAISSDSE